MRFILAPAMFVTCLTALWFDQRCQVLRRMSGAAAQSSAGDEWHLYVPSKEAPLQPYRSTPTAWPISAVEVQRYESQAAAGNPSALNSLGTVSWCRAERCMALILSVSGCGGRYGASVWLGSAAHQPVQSVCLLLPGTQRKQHNRHPQSSSVQVVELRLQTERKPSVVGAHRFS